jgi:putative peptidoglycan binding protein
MPVTHIVKQGECLSRIAHQYGFNDYRTVWNDSANSDLRSKRPNPNLLHPGDQVCIPDKRPKDESRDTGTTHEFSVRRQPRLLRLKLLYDDGRPIANADYHIQGEGFDRKGTTNADGMLEERIALHSELSTLEIAGVTWNMKIAHLNPLDDVADRGVSGYQQRLRNLGYDPGPIDGIDGPRTKAAVRAFQSDNPPLQIDGICGPKTKAKLKELHGS